MADPEFYRSIYGRFHKKQSRLAKHAGVQETLFLKFPPKSVEDFIEGLTRQRWGDLSAGGKGAVGSMFNTCAPDSMGFVLVHNILSEYNQEHDDKSLRDKVRDLAEEIVNDGTKLSFIAWKLSERSTRVINDRTGMWLSFSVVWADTDNYDEALAWMVLAKEKEVSVYGIVQVWDPDPVGERTPFHVMALVGSRSGVLKAKDVSRDGTIKDVSHKDFFMALLVSPVAQDGKPPPQADAGYEEYMREVLPMEIPAPMAGEEAAAEKASEEGQMVSRSIEVAGLGGFDDFDETYAPHGMHEGNPIWQNADGQYIYYVPALHRWRLSEALGHPTQGFVSDVDGDAPPEGRWTWLEHVVEVQYV